MKIKSTESLRVYRTTGAGCARIMAVPMIVLGGALIYMGSWILFANHEMIQSVVAAIACLTGAIILSVAVPILSTLKGVTLDRIQGTATEWRKIFGRNKVLGIHKLNEFASLEISSHRPKRVTIYRLQLTGEHKKILLCELGLVEKVKEDAQDASTFLSLPVIDNIPKEEVQD